MYLLQLLPRFFIVVSTLSMTVLLFGCTQDKELDNQTVEASIPVNMLTDHLETSSKVVAKVGNKTITLDTLNQSIQLALYDLEWKMYELKYSQLENMIMDLQDPSDSSQTSEILLEPPQPPRINLPSSTIRSGKIDSPIVLSVFCSFQSPHCARLQPVLMQLNEFYGELISDHYFDFPQRFHRYGKAAANAARCANEFTVYEPFINALYMDVSNLNKARYQAIASQLNVDKEQYLLCLDKDRYRLDIESDVSLAHSLGLGNVPIAFINGLYTKGLTSFEAYQYYIDQELARLGLKLVQAEIDTSEDESVSDLIENTQAEVELADEQKLYEGSSEQRELPVTGKMTLAQDWLQTQLLNQTELETYFFDAEHVVNGMYNLIKLKDVEQQEFYTTLGLKDGDVLMQVNGEWVHSGQNSLWDTLSREEPVSLIVMRKGYPLRYDYVVK
jgi:protein-disulfide isomerase